MNLMPILLAYIEYYSDTISTDASYTRVLWPLSLPLPMMFVIWNYFTQTEKFDMDSYEILPILPEEDSSSFDLIYNPVNDP